MKSTKVSLTKFTISPKKLPRVRPSKRVCEERLACKGNKPISNFYCSQCEAYQCEACKLLLHENPKFLLHDPQQLVLPSEYLICQGECESENFADVTCDSCKKNYCFACDITIHVLGKKTHKRSTFELRNEEFLSCEPMLESCQREELEFACKISEMQDLISSKTHPLSYLPDVAYNDLETYNVGDKSSLIDKIERLQVNPRSFLLVDDQEQLQVSSESEFIEKLGCDSQNLVKVICIFGNTGDGKSHTLNHTFYDGKEIFKTSAAQSSCTLGVWAAYDSILDVVTIDTEGLLGITVNQNKRTRLLLKVMAISDIVIYRTLAERLHSDMLTFLGDASKAYIQHFSGELQAASKRCQFAGPLSSLGPAVVIFHETRHTDVLSRENNCNPEDEIKGIFQEQDLRIDAFSAIEYVGIKTADFPTSFISLQTALKKHLENSSVRSARRPGVIYQALKVLNEKFSGDIDRIVPSTFPDQYFRCPVQCVSCNSRCLNSMNHERDGILHSTSNKCRYQHQYNNQIFLCKNCYERGQDVKVSPKTSSSASSTLHGLMSYAWVGYILECPNCGIIYRSRQHWFGNKEPWETSVRTEIQHVWPCHSYSQDNQNLNAAQRVLDGIQYLSCAVTSVSSKPAKAISSWMADQIAPSYWVPNYLITKCELCEKQFSSSDTKHHCRACGKGFCEDCSSQTRPVPEKGWGNLSVRVCDICYKKALPEDKDSVQDPSEVAARKVGEAIHSTLWTLVSAIDYPLGLIKESARPSYWIPDHEITCCCVCKKEFSEKLTIHHCRSCGEGVCEYCSPSRKPVPSRDWNHPVRVCNTCNKIDNLIQ